jgi:hypothetical protein
MPRPRGPSQATLAFIAQCHAILVEIQPTTVRGVAYRLFTSGWIPSMEEKQTKRVSEKLTIARERGLLPWEWIVDTTRQVEKEPGWRDPAAYMEVVRASYRKDWWADQPERVIVVSEKATVGGMLGPVLREYGVGFLVLHGWSSATALHDWAQWTVQDDRPVTIIYVGDFDPSGRNMIDVDVPGRLKEYEGRATILRLADNPKQIATYNLPTFSAHTKKSDTRYPWFLATHGETCAELDALNPNILRALVQQAIEARIDWERWERAETTEQAEMASLADFLDSWPGDAA